MASSSSAETEDGDSQNLSIEGSRGRQHFCSGAHNQGFNDNKSEAADSIVNHSADEKDDRDILVSGFALSVSSQQITAQETPEQILCHHGRQLSQWKQDIDSYQTNLLHSFLPKITTGAITQDQNFPLSSEGEAKVGSDLLECIKALDCRQAVSSNRSESGPTFCLSSTDLNNLMQTPTDSAHHLPESKVQSVKTDGSLQSENDPSFFISLTSEDLEHASGDSAYQMPALKVDPFMAYYDALELCARCEELDCEKAACTQIKSLLSDIERGWSLTSNHSNLLICMYKHCVTCDMQPCLFPWCFPQLCNSLPKLASPEDMIKTMRHRTTNRLYLISVSKSRDSHEVIKFDPRIGFDSVCTGNQVWTSLCLLCRYSQAVLAKPHPRYMTEPHQYWVLKRVARHSTPAVWDLYLKLAKLRDLKSLSPLLWAAYILDSPGSYIMVCSALEGISLYEHMQSCKYLPLDLVLIARIMTSLLSALAHLHALDIVYLNWTSKNVLVHQDLSGLICVKLINFESSAIAGSVKDSMSTLPVHLFPPELLSGETMVNLPSDIWGVACLLYELTAGHPVWHKHRHMSVPELKKLMMEEPQHEHPSSCHRNLTPVFDACWKVDPKERVDIDGLLNLLNKV